MLWDYLVNAPIGNLSFLSAKQCGNYINTTDSYMMKNGKVDNNFHFIRQKQNNINKSDIASNSVKRTY